MLESIRCFVVQRVLFYSESCDSHPVDYLIVISSCPLPSIVVRSSSFFTHFITISPLVPPSIVDCCFKRQTKPLLPTMVSSLSSRPSALVSCFRCPPPPTLATFPWQSSSAVRCPHSRRFDVAVAVSSPCRSDTAGGPPPLRILPNSCGAIRGLALQSSASWVRDNAQLPSSPPPTLVCASSSLSSSSPSPRQRFISPHRSRGH